MLALWPLTEYYAGAIALLFPALLELLFFLLRKALEPTIVLERIGSGDVL